MKPVEIPQNPDLLNTGLKKVATLFGSHPDYKIGVEGFLQVVESGFTDTPAITKLFTGFSERIQVDPKLATNFATIFSENFDQAKVVGSTYNSRTIVRTASLLGIEDHPTYSPDFIKALKDYSAEQAGKQISLTVEDPSKRSTLKMLVLGAASLLVPKDLLRSAIPHPNPDTQQVAKEEPSSPIEELLKPFINAAMEKRAERAKNDPEYTKRVDMELNQDTVNFLLFGYGETFEPPAADKVIIGSHTIVTYNTQTQKISMVSLTHDIRAPEIERYLQKQGIKTAPTKIDQAYKVGGFDLMRDVIEDATGFAIDYQFSMRDNMIRDIVDQVGGLAVDIPFDLKTQEYYLDDLKYPRGEFRNGSKSLTGVETMQFMKALAEDYNPETERNMRKHIIIDALVHSMTNLESSGDVITMSKFLSLLMGKYIDGTLASDANLNTLLGSGLSILYEKARKKLGNIFTGVENKKTNLSIHRKVYIVDSAVNKDGGVMWVTASPSPVMKKDLETGVYVDKAVEVPDGATTDPYARDLITNYWSPVREVVKSKILQQ